MSLPTEPTILDVTLRDGSYLINHQYTPEVVSEVAVKLFEAGIKNVEISHGAGIGSRMMGMAGLVDDEELLEAAKKAAPNIDISIFISPMDFCLPLIPGLVDFISLGRVGVNIDEVEKAEKFIQKLKKYNKTVSVQLVRSHGRTPEQVGVAAKKAQELGADIVYLVDTFGSFTPEEVKTYLAAMHSQIKIATGFHGHNHIGLALANTLQAWKQGATWLDASILGLGRGSGNTNLASLIFKYQQKEMFSKISVPKLGDIWNENLKLLFQTPPHSRLRDIAYSQSKLDFPSDPFFELLAHFFHQNVWEFSTNVRSFIGESLQVSDDDLKRIFEKYGEDYENFISKMKEDSPNDTQTNSDH